MGVFLVVAGALILRYAHPIGEWLPEKWETMRWGYRRPAPGSKPERFERRYRVAFLILFGLGWIACGLLILIQA